MGLSGVKQGKAASLLKELELSIRDFLSIVEAANAERDSSYAELRMLRDAIARIDSNLGKKVDLLRLQGWVESKPSVDLSDSSQIRRFANLYVLEQVPDQEWELRYRPAVAGRALILLTLVSGFPTREMLLTFDGILGLKPVYIVTVKKPSWRVVLQTSTQGWDWLF